MKLLSMSLENFMCYASAEFDFYAITKIMAKNGKGKSSIATAYMWCLFNCDYDLKDNPPVRREVDGKTVDDMDTVVTLALDVDGKEVTMRKVQKRTYSILSSISFQNFLPNISQYLKNGFFCGADFDTPLPEL